MSSLNNGTPIQETVINDQGTPVYLSLRGCGSPEHRVPLMRLDTNTGQTNVRERAAREEQVIMEKIKSDREKFRRYINKSVLVGKMEEQGLFTEREKYRFLAGGDSVDIDALIKMLEHKSEDAFTLFYLALKAEKSHKGHQDLAGHIEDVL